jgi:hypothetical protein
MYLRRVFAQSFNLGLKYRDQLSTLRQSLGDSVKVHRAASFKVEPRSLGILNILKDIDLLLKSLDLDVHGFLVLLAALKQFGESLSITDERTQLVLQLGDLIDVAVVAAANESQSGVSLGLEVGLKLGQLLAELVLDSLTARAELRLGSVQFSGEIVEGSVDRQQFLLLLLVVGIEHVRLEAADGLAQSGLVKNSLRSFRPSESFLASSG